MNKETTTSDRLANDIERHAHRLAIAILESRRAELLRSLRRAIHALVDLDIELADAEEALRIEQARKPR